MALQEEMERSGQWLFRWRSWLPLILVPIAAFSFIGYHYPFGTSLADAIWEGICLFIGFLGLAIRIWTIGGIPAGTSGRNTKTQVANKLNISGIYSIVRHPLYLGNFFMMLSVVMFTHHTWLIIVFVLLFFIYYERIMFREESFLRDKYGDEFLRWAEKTPLFIPRFSNYRPSELRFSVKTVLGREYNGLFALVLCMFSLETVSEWIVKKRVEIDLFWGILFGITLLIWLVLRFLKHHTSLLKTQGR